MKHDAVEIKDDDIVITENIPGVSTSSKPEPHPQKKSCIYLNRYSKQKI